MSDICLTCCGMIFYRQETVGYSGPICDCIPAPRIQRPALQERKPMTPELTQELEKVLEKSKRNIDDYIKNLYEPILLEVRKLRWQLDILMIAIKGKDRQDYNSVECVLACMAEGEGSDPEVYVQMSSAALKRLREALAEGAKIRGEG